MPDRGIQRIHHLVKRRCHATQFSIGTAGTQSPYPVTCGDSQRRTATRRGPRPAPWGAACLSL
jgi:hypothetical protein